MVDARSHGNSKAAAMHVIGTGSTSGNGMPMGKTVSDKNHQQQPDTDADSPPSDLSYPGALALDVEKYRPYMNDFEIGEEQKVELLRTLWEIMRACVDLSFGVDNIKKRIPALVEFASQNEPDRVQTERSAGVDNTSN